MWKYQGQQRPPFAEVPGPRQESVWDYPRPPAIVTDTRLVEVLHDGVVLARSRATRRVLETASPPTFYLPRSDVDLSRLVAAAGSSFCEWKGAASYWALAAAPEAGAVGWSYQDATAGFEVIEGALSFYPGRVACFVDGERVRPQPGQFYGGWLTNEIVGPCKGAPGSGHW